MNRCKDCIFWKLERMKQVSFQCNDSTPEHTIILFESNEYTKTTIDVMKEKYLKYKDMGDIETYGTCSCPSFNMEKFDTEVYIKTTDRFLSFSDENIDVLVGRDFGCIHWEKK